MESLSAPPRRPLLAAASFFSLVALGVGYVVLSGDDTTPPATTTSSAPATSSTPAGPSSTRVTPSTPSAPPVFKLATGVKAPDAPQRAYQLPAPSPSERATLAAAFDVTAPLEEDAGVHRAGGLRIWPSGQWTYTGSSMQVGTPVTSSPRTTTPVALIDEAAAEQEARRIAAKLGVAIDDVSVLSTTALVIVRITSKHDSSPLLPGYVFSFTTKLATATGHIPRSGPETSFAPKSLAEVLASTSARPVRVAGSLDSAISSQVTITAAAKAWLLAADTTTARLIPGWVLTDATGGSWAVAADPAYQPFMPPVPSSGS